jgi:chromosome segregation ATPase
MSTLITAIIAGVIFLGAAFVLQKYLAAKQRGAGISSNIGEVEEKISDTDAAIQNALAHVESMMPLAKLKEREEELEGLNQQLGVEREKLEKLDKQVEKLQKTIEEEESAHNELKKGREEASTLADDVRANKERLASEYQQLESELKQSLSNLEALNTEVDLTADQQIAVDKIQGALESARVQLSTLSEMHSQAATRFTNLEAQYVELEKEFTKLVEKELSGEM